MFVPDKIELRQFGPQGLRFIDNRINRYIFYTFPFVVKAYLPMAFSAAAVLCQACYAGVMSSATDMTTNKRVNLHIFHVRFILNIPDDDVIAFCLNISGNLDIFCLHG